jgi:FMN phosphatase YigB (HAD superfamily)
VPRVIVFDFDGTMTDAEQEGAPFRGGYLEDLAALTGLPMAEIEASAARFEAEVAANPQRFGWIFGGHIVAPAIVDPYLRMMPVARRILDEAGAFMVEAERTRLLDAILYKYNYTKTHIAFREGARELLLGLRGQEVHIVTNSHTDAVQHKLKVLGTGNDGVDSLAWLQPRVVGRARKYIIDPSFEAVPEALTLPGLSRPVLLRRKHYHDVLEGILNAAGASWSELTVVGDIFELDLCLPAAMGATVALITNPFTPDYERAYLASIPNGRLLSHLAAAAPLVSE